MTIENGIYLVFVQKRLDHHAHFIILLVMWDVGVIPRSVEGNKQPRSHRAVHICKVVLQPFVHLTCGSIRNIVVQHNNMSRSNVDTVVGVVGDSLNDRESMGTYIGMG